MFKAIGRFFAKVTESLARTRDRLGGALRRLIGLRRTIDAAFLQELEDTLLQADIGVAKTEEILGSMRKRWKDGDIAESADLLQVIRDSLRAELGEVDSELIRAAHAPTVVLVVGVNGAGKTTTIAKLAKRLMDQGRTVLVGAGDTYRAAAIEQLEIWADRAGVPIVKSQAGGDAAAVAFDAVAAAQARGIDTVLIDTAGRLHTKEHLMRELDKVRRVIQKRLPDAPHEVLLIIDGTAGQNAVTQAKAFQESIGVTGVVVTKLDGTAKGGAVFTIRRALGLPVRFIGVGEGMDDLQPFDPDAFVAAIFGDETR